MTEKQYPEFPQTVSSYYDEVDKEVVYTYSATQMREYADATCALRAAQPGEPVGWLYDFECDGEVIRDWLTSNYDEASSPTNGCHNIRPLYLALATQPSMQHATFAHATQPQEAAPSQEGKL